MDASAIKQEEGTEQNNIKILRNFKFRVPPLLSLKKEYMELNIKKEVPDCIDFSDISDTTMNSHSRCSTSDTTGLVSIKTENMTEALEESSLIDDLPLKCLIEEPFACSHCTFTSLSEEEFQKHVVLHYMEKPFSCEMCPFITKRRGALKNHMLTHSKVKRFSCEFCTFKTCYKGSLKTHMQIHTGDKQFNCDYCSFKTNYKNRHDQHMLSHTGERSFFCDYCTFKTRRKGDFKEHILGHTQPFKCQLCLYETSSINLLSSHMLNCCVLIRPKKRVSLD